MVQEEGLKMSNSACLKLPVFLKAEAEQAECSYLSQFRGLLYVLFCFSVAVTNKKGKQLKRKDLFWLLVSSELVHGFLVA